MARILSQTLVRESASLVTSKSVIPLSPSSRLLNLRNRSSGSEKSFPQQQLLEVVDLGSDAGADGIGMRRLEDAIYGLIIRRSAPDWLPFVPGASYWVPPRGTSLGLAELIRKLENPLSYEETMSLTTDRGWPSSSYYGRGAPPPVKEKSKKKVAESEDEES